MRVLGWTLAVTLLATPTVVSGADGKSPDKAVKRQLQRQLDAHPDDPMAIANLARHYLMTEQPAKARRLYQGLLSLENVALERERGAPVWSHALARSALSTLDQRMPVRLGSR